MPPSIAISRAASTPSSAPSSSGPKIDPQRNPSKSGGSRRESVIAFRAAANPASRLDSHACRIARVRSGPAEFGVAMEVQQVHGRGEAVGDRQVAFERR